MAARGSLTVQGQGQRSEAAAAAALPPAMGQAFDFSSAGSGQTDSRAHAPPAMGQAFDVSSAGAARGSEISKASIEVASAEALQILQRHYGSTTLRSSRAAAAHRGLDVEGGGAAHTQAFNGDHGWLVHSHVKHSIGFALVVPFLILAPWMNGVMASLVRAIIGPSELAVQSGTAAISYAEHTVVLRLVGLLVGGGLFALIFKLFLTVPCIRFGGWSSHVKGCEDIILDTEGGEGAAVAASERPDARLPSAAAERHSYGATATDDVQSCVAGGGSRGLHRNEVNLLPERLARPGYSCDRAL